MSPESNVLTEELIDQSILSAPERAELVALGVLTPSGAPAEPRAALVRPRTPPVPRQPITSLTVLNEAFAYAIPSSFSRGLRVPVGDVDLLFISGTASIDDQGRTVNLGDFRAQCWRTYRNITTLLESEGATWHDVIKTTCYLRDIERDYREFNRVRTAFFKWLQLDPLPASVGIQARLCREDLLVEIEGLAVIGRRCRSWRWFGPCARCAVRGASRCSAHGARSAMREVRCARCARVRGERGARGAPCALLFVAGPHGSRSLEPADFRGMPRLARTSSQHSPSDCASHPHPAPAPRTAHLAHGTPCAPRTPRTTP